MLAFSAIQNNDKVGVILFGNKIEKFISPKKGSAHILRIIRELINFEPTSRETDIAEALRYFTNVIKKKSTAFLISDLIGKKFDDAIKITNKKHDLVAVRVYDVRETEIPPMGLVKVKDAETGKMIWVNTSSQKVRDHYKIWWKQQEERVNDLLKKSGVDAVSIRTDQDYVRPLMNLFKKREK